MTFVSDFKKLKSQGKQILSSSEMIHLFAFFTTFFTRRAYVVHFTLREIYGTSLLDIICFSALSTLFTLCFETNEDLKR